MLDIILLYLQLINKLSIVIKKKTNFSEFQ